MYSALGAVTASLRGILGDPSEANLQAPVGSYEDLHTAVQAILLPPTLPSGLGFHLLQPLGRGLAAQHRLSFVPGEVHEGKPPFVPPSQDPGVRTYAVGGVAAHVLAGGGKWRLSGQVDVEKQAVRASVLGDVWGEGRLRLLGQAAAAPVAGAAGGGGGRGGGSRAPAGGGSRWGGEWGATATLRGEDYVAVARVKHGVEVGASYCQRLAPGSPVSLGGELMLNVPALAAAQAAAGGSGSGSAARGSRPLELALGCAYDAEDSRTAVHYAQTTAFSSGVLSLHHLLRVTERSHLAAKLITDTAVSQSMVAAGYKMHFRNTRTTLHGMVDSYGSIRQVRGRARARAGCPPLLPALAHPPARRTRTLFPRRSLKQSPSRTSRWASASSPRRGTRRSWASGPRWAPCRPFRRPSAPSP